eukprot:1299922-Pyramimonas_sp.AAC.1
MRTEMARSRVVEARGKPPEEIPRVCSSRARAQEASRKRHEVTKAVRNARRMSFHGTGLFADAQDGADAR